MIRRIRELLYDQGFTISGARNKLQEMVQAERDKRRMEGDEAIDVADLVGELSEEQSPAEDLLPPMPEVAEAVLLGGVRRELLEIRDLLSFKCERAK